MKRLAIMLVGVAGVAGCVWRPWAKTNDVIMPDEEYATSMPAEPVGPPAGEPATRASADVYRGSSDVPASPAVRIVRGSEVVDAAMIQVNDKFITLGQVLHPIRERLGSAPAGLSEQDFRLKATELVREEIKRQVEQTLLLGEADRKLTEAERNALEAEVSQRHRRALAEQDGSESRLRDRLVREGTTLDEWLKDLRRGLTVQAYLQRHVFDQIRVTRRDLMDYYKAHPQEFRTRGRLQMQIVAAPLSVWLPIERPPTEPERDEAKQFARKQIDLASADLAGGKDFAAVARTHSRGPMASAGGVWPMMDVGSFKATRVEQAAYRQKVGETSKVIESPLGYYIVRTLACRPGRDLPFERIQGQIRELLRRHEYEQRARTYLQGLRDRAVIVVADGFERVAVDAAVAQFHRK